MTPLYMISISTALTMAASLVLMPGPNSLFKMGTEHFELLLHMFANLLLVSMTRTWAVNAAGLTRLNMHLFVAGTIALLGDTAPMRC